MFLIVETGKEQDIPQGFIEITTIGDMFNGQRVYIPGPDYYEPKCKDKMGFIDVKEPHTGKMLFRFDPERNLVEIRRAKATLIVDLRPYREQKGIDKPCLICDTLPRS